MRLSDELNRADLPSGKSPPRLRTIYALGGLALFMTAALVVKAHSRFPDPFPNWMTEANRWYDDLLSAVVWASIAVACFVYLRYRADAERTGRVAAARPWRARRDVRLVLYTFAATSFAQFPIGVYRSIVALSDPTTPAFTHNISSVFPIGAVLFPLMGVALILYDRRRTRREERLAGNLCSVCGYDLRASPERCPECGTLTHRGHPAAA
jgi:hypothetical protein